MKGWVWWLIAGILSLIGGFFALANPLASTLAAEMLAAYMFLVVGVLTILSAFADQGWGQRILAILMGLVFTLVGISMISNPLQGILSLTAVVGIFILVGGIMRVLIGLAGGGQARWLLVLSGVVSLLLGIMILANYPWSALSILGILLGIELIFNGVGLIAVAMARKAVTA